MKLRAPAVPLITVDPYFSLWSPTTVINQKQTVHWTGSRMPFFGTVSVDGEAYSFLGYNRNARKMPETFLDIDALSTKLTFEGAGIRLDVRFMTPLIPKKYEIMTRPVSYMGVTYTSVDGKAHTVRVSVDVSAAVCLNGERDSAVTTEELQIGTVRAVRMGNASQNPLNRSGDNLRIDWGHFYLCAQDADATGSVRNSGGVTHIALASGLCEGQERLFLYAYDDGVSIDYFGKHLRSYWNRDGKTIEQAIAEAAEQYPALCELCDGFSDELYASAYMAGGEKYAELLALSYRQVIAAHKLAVTEDGEILFISKECFSNGCAATVDVSYPSIPLFLLYDPELIKGMLRPVYRFAADPRWKYDYAPHDVGQYPLVTGQVYGLDRATGELRHESQMPVEECGNMIIMETNIALAEGNADFAARHMDVLRGWCEYLIRYGDDPENQLCTDDFAGHLSHNCNLALKAIMGIAGMSVLSRMTGDTAEADRYASIAKQKAASWCERAKNADGSYRLAFDRPDSFSMKYNMVWDKIWGTGLFPEAVIEAEIASNLTRICRYGMPLDSRAEYTKSDWLVWTATMARRSGDFKKFITPLWQAYNDSESRVPMTDWYDAVSALQVEFQNRTVQGGLFIKLLDKTRKLRVGKL